MSKFYSSNYKVQIPIPLDHLKKKKNTVLISEEEMLNARTDDVFLAAFLRGRKHDVDKAFQCVSDSLVIISKMLKILFHFLLLYNFS